MASSNPFRKKHPDPINTTSIASKLAAGPESPAPSSTSAPDGSKPVKKVRVLSPPPVSPGSPEWPSSTGAAAINMFPTRGHVTYGLGVFPPAPDAGASSNSNISSSSSSSSFANGGPGSPSTSMAAVTTITPPPLHSQSQPNPAATDATLTPSTSTAPANPFSKTLQDLEHARLDAELHKERREEGAALKAANAARRSLNVDSFHRLLMTGNAGPAVAPSTDSSLAGDGTPSTTTTSSMPAADNSGLLADASRRLHHDQDATATATATATAQDSDRDSDKGSASDSSANLQVGTRSKKPAPPPPSSRHGRSLKVELKDERPQSQPPTASAKPATDFNKPLPLPPSHGTSQHEETESPFDKEAAGKIPEPEPLPSTMTQQKRSIPAPPPRRGHSRTDTKTQIQHSPAKPVDDDDISFMEGLSRSNSIRHAAPAPPPPRRGRPLSGIVSPTAASFSSAHTPMSPPMALAEPEHQNYTASPEPLTESPPPLASSRAAAPPPPPARGASVRRPPSIHSVHSIDNTSRRASGDSRMFREGPPPPPPRARGSSRSSLEGPPSRTSIDRSARPRISQIDIPTDSGKSVDILADLSALQREVDALRGKLG